MFFLFPACFEVEGGINCFLTNEEDYQRHLKGEDLFWCLGGAFWSSYLEAESQNLRIIEVQNG